MMSAPNPELIPVNIDNAMTPRTQGLLYWTFATIIGRRPPNATVNEGPEIQRSTRSNADGPWPWP